MEKKKYLEKKGIECIVVDNLLNVILTEGDRMAK